MRFLLLAVTPRYIVLTLAIMMMCAGLILAVSDLHWLILALPGFGLSVIGIYDLMQIRHSILRTYPISAHLRFLLEHVRAEIRQYFLENDIEGTPFSRDKRSVVYQRAKGQADKRPFGTQLDVYATSFSWINHSMLPHPLAPEPFHVTVGNSTCRHLYSASVLNISAMSFGALSANAIRALNKGAKIGHFAQDTGEGGVSAYHREFGGDLIWEIGTGYFGCRDDTGRFSPEQFAERVSEPQIKMIEIKLSQGAKPGHGGVLPGPKVTAEIAAARGVPLGQECLSPASHSAFSTPLELMRFIGGLRRLSDGKPVGLKLCIGHDWEFMAVCKAMLATQIIPDFIVIDGAEGGTGAAPLEFADHLGTPLRDGLIFAHNALVGTGLRSHIKLGASGKIASAFDMARVMALGADWCNSARGFMFAIGCIQSRGCHTGRCPTGVATQDPLRQRSLVVSDKAGRVQHFHASTVHALAEIVAAAGIDHPSELRPHHLSIRVLPNQVETYNHLYRFLLPEELLEGTSDPRYQKAWSLSSAESFLPMQ